MNIHAEIIKDMNITRGEYLKAIRKEQPIAELERKARKSERHKGKLWTQEQIDLHIAQSMQMVSKMVLG